jgi:5'-phosphate synthase pdxT subunit
MPIGILALQGDFDTHAQMLTALGESVRFIRSPEQLEGCEGLILPGGESSTLLRLMGGDQDAWFYALQHFAKTHWVFGTCAGMILMAHTVSPMQPSLGLMAITVERNAYGRQRDSRIIHLPYQTHAGTSIEVECVFIRAPKVTANDETIEVLVEEQGTPSLLQQGHLMAASFHPESSNDSQLYADCLARLRTVL